MNDQPAQIDPENLDPAALNELVHSLEPAALNDLVKGLDTESINKLVRAADPETAKALLRKVDPGNLRPHQHRPRGDRRRRLRPRGGRDRRWLHAGGEAGRGHGRPAARGDRRRGLPPDARAPERGQRGAADAVINWEIPSSGGEADRYTVRVENGTCIVEEGHHPSPRVSLEMDAVTFLRLVTGNLNPVTAFMAGQITIQGDLMFAASVTTLFHIPSGAPAGPPASAAA